MKNNKKGFTLIELLAVIVILAIIALIAVPQVLKILNKSRKNAAEDSVYGAVESAENYVAILLVKNVGGLPSGNIEFECNGTTCSLTSSSVTNLEGYTYENSLLIKGTVPKEGKIIISENGKKIESQNLKVNNFDCYYQNGKATCGGSSSSNTTTVTLNSNLATSKLKVGDLVNMIPTNSSYTVTASAAGYTKDQVMNTGALTLWRVIKNDGTTVELVSEYISQEDIYFGDNTSANTIAAYANYIKTLNDIANAYRNTTYTSSARSIGYSNQTETITNTTKFSDSQTTPPWSCESGYSCNPTESEGGGDTGYRADFDAVRIAYGASGVDTSISYGSSASIPYLVGYRHDSTNNTDTAKPYWVASRYYGMSNTTFSFSIRRYTTGGLGGISMRKYNGVWSYGSWGSAVRPIVTLDSTKQIKVVLDGNDGSISEKAYNLTID